jgi:hypothetical protein
MMVSLTVVWKVFSKAVERVDSLVVLRVERLADALVWLTDLLMVVLSAD